MKPAVSSRLQQAKDYEQKQEQEIEPMDRPEFHLTPRIGWMNDPNGFSFYQGAYHLFYQYNPYGTHWDAMHWGHAKSQDLLHWEYLPAALAPDQAYDSRGCYSGSAIELAEGQILLMYTGVSQQLGEDGQIQEIQAQCIAIGDGVHFTKHPANPVIQPIHLPNGGIPEHFRDPKIFRRKDGSFGCVLVNKTADGLGQVLLYESPDAIHWDYVSVLAKNTGNLGTMWECPDFFSLDGKDCLIVSPQDMTPKGEFTNGNNTLVFLGSFDPETKEYAIEGLHTLDSGIDFYAPQTCQGPDGRQILIAWLQNWDTLSHRDSDSFWFGQMALPRRLKIQNDRLVQEPIQEIENLQRKPVRLEKFLSTASYHFPGIEGRSIDLHLHIKPISPNLNFLLALAMDERRQTTIEYNFLKQTLTLDRQQSGSNRACLHTRTCQLINQPRELDLRILMDRMSLEIFINDGQQTMSSTLFTPLSANQIELTVEGSMFIKIEKYDLL